MKIAFNSPLTGTDPTGAAVTLSPADIDALTYTIFLDTVNPPVKTYPVPVANVAAGVANTDGSHRITVDAIKDLNVAVLNNQTYYVAIEDQEGNAISPESAILTYVYKVTPGPVGNPSVA
jgi:hypothetical protein